MNFLLKRTRLLVKDEFEQLSEPMVGAGQVTLAAQLSGPLLTTILEGHPEMTGASSSVTVMTVVPNTMLVPGSVTVQLMVVTPTLYNPSALPVPAPPVAPVLVQATSKEQFSKILSTSNPVTATAQASASAQMAGNNMHPSSGNNGAKQSPKSAQ